MTILILSNCRGQYLPVPERRDLNFLKATHKAIYCQQWPEYAKLEVNKPTITLRFSSTLNLRRGELFKTFLLNFLITYLTMLKELLQITIYFAQSSKIF